MPEIDYRDPRPIYEQLAGVFESLILSGALEKGSQMPSVRDTAARFSLNPNTVQKAFSKLEEDGFIYAVKGRGNYVAEKEPILLKKQDLFLAEFRKTVSKGKELMISEERMEKALHEEFKGGKKDND